MFDGNRITLTGLAADIDSTDSWRSDYVPLVGRVTAGSAESSKAALALAYANGVPTRALAERSRVAAQRTLALDLLVDRTQLVRVPVDLPA